MGRLLTLSEITLSSPQGHPTSFVHSSVGNMQKNTTADDPTRGKYGMASYNHGTLSQQTLEKRNKITYKKKNPTG